MKVIATDAFMDKATITLPFFDGQSVSFKIETIPMDELLKTADFISLHVPAQKNYIIGEAQFKNMKNGVGVINAARGGVIDEIALINAIENKKVKYAALDVFENEPTPEMQLLMNPEISLTPHIGAATKEAQDRIGTELATQIIALLKE